MCNAFNHPPGCTCGWGGSGHSGRGSGRILGVSKNDGAISYEKIHGQTDEKILEAYYKKIGTDLYRVLRFKETGKEISEYNLLNETRPMVCKYCGEEIFFYQNENGSKVFFDSLGTPWPKHECKEYLEYINTK